MTQYRRLAAYVTEMYCLGPGRQTSGVTVSAGRLLLRPEENLLHPSPGFWRFPGIRGVLGV